MEDNGEKCDKQHMVFDSFTNKVLEVKAGRITMHEGNSGAGPTCFTGVIRSLLAQ